jgi:hypothetical protein
VQDQLKQLQDAIEALRSEQQLMKVELESTVRSTAQNSIDLEQITHTVTDSRKVIDLLDRQLQVANNWGDNNARGVGILLGRTNNLESDLRQIKARLGLY